jgi:hypothetical protein
MQAPQENPYNGGLIDFHDSALRADLSAALYAHQLAAAQSTQYAQAPAAGPYPIQAHAASPYPMQAHAAYPPAPPQPQHYHAAYAQPAAPAPLAPPVQSMVMAQAPGQCIAGPPAFLHLHGQVYAPIEESAAPTPEPAALKAAPAVPSGKALDRMVEQRVEQRVNEYFSKNKAKALGASVRSRKAAKPEATLKELNGAMRARLSAY